VRNARTPRARLAVAALAVVSITVAACEGPRSRENQSLRVATQTTPGTGTGAAGQPAKAIVDTSACTGNPTDGISGDTITLGTSLPESGLYSAFSQILQGEKSYFGMLNAAGGVEVAGKRYKIKIIDKDDAYEANKTLTNVQDLINSEKVFALFNVVGTSNNFAIRDLISQLCVPDLFAATGSPAWGNHKYPFVLGTELVPYPVEVKSFLDYLKAKHPGATIAALYASDDFGGAYKATLHALIKGTGLRIVKEASYNPDTPDTKSQVTGLASTKADAFLLGATLLGCPQTLSNVRASGWKPITYMSGTCAAKTLMDIAGPAGDGVITSAPLIDPAAPTTKAMAFYKQYAAAVAKYGTGAATDSSIVAYGWTTAALLVELLHRSPKLDRYSVMETARTLTDLEGLGFMPPGAKFNTSANDWYLGETYNLVQFSYAKKYFADISPLIDDDGKTAEISPSSLING